MTKLQFCLVLALLLLFYYLFDTPTISHDGKNIRVDNLKLKLRKSRHHHSRTNTLDESSHASNPHPHGESPLPPKRNGSQNHRIAILIPYVGANLPPYFPLFAKTAAGSSSLVDFFIVHNGISPTLLPPPDQQYPNVKFIDLQSTQQMTNLLLRVIDERSEENLEMSYSELLQILTKHIDKYPYVLVEFKAAMGHIFARYLEGYSHWGYSDLDIAFGDLPQWVTEEELTEFDIVTYGYGDQDRLYLRGQFTFHKNEQKINQLWRECQYLSEMDVRFARVKQGIDKLSFESAEGCYSHVILKQNDIKVKYAVKAFTDITETDTVYTHGLYIATGEQSGRSVLYKAGPNPGDGSSLRSLPLDWFEQEKYSNLSHPNSLTTKSLQWETGPRTIAKLHNENENVKCMYWAHEKYQSNLCAMDVNSDDTVFWINGVLYKQNYVTAEFPENIKSFPLFHFQEWKRVYRLSQMSPLIHSNDMGIQGMILTQNGILPITPPNKGQKDKNHELFSTEEKVKAWAATTHIEDQTELPTSIFCLRSSIRKFPPTPHASECKEYVSWQDENYVDIVTHGETWDSVDVNQDVTLALTLQINADVIRNKAKLDGLLNLAEANIRIWGKTQPSVLLVHVAGATKDVANTIYKRFQSNAEKNGKDGQSEGDEQGLYSSCLMAIMLSSNIEVVSRKALLNMASAAAPTRFVVSGLELERGSLLSKETSLFAKRTAIIYGDSPGNVFVIPQFAAKNNVKKELVFDSIGVEELFEKGSSIELSRLVEMDCAHCTNGDTDDYYDSKKDNWFLMETNIENQINEIWRDVTRFDLSDKAGTIKEDSERYTLFDHYEKLQLDLIHLLQPENEKILRNFDVNPLLMVDSIGPWNGAITRNLALEVEEFGGLRCFNAFRLVQLAVLGYDIQVLPGAFSVSFPSSRESATGNKCRDEDKHGIGLSRCDGCFMFEYMDLLESIAMDERNRTAKTAILWNELTAFDETE